MGETQCDTSKGLQVQRELCFQVSLQHCGAKGKTLVVLLAVRKARAGCKKANQLFSCHLFWRTFHPSTSLIGSKLKCNHSKGHVKVEESR